MENKRVVIRLENDSWVEIPFNLKKMGLNLNQLWEKVYETGVTEGVFIFKNKINEVGDCIVIALSKEQLNKVERVSYGTEFLDIKSGVPKHRN